MRVAKVEAPRASPTVCKRSEDAMPFFPWLPLCRAPSVAFREGDRRSAVGKPEVGKNLADPLEPKSGGSGA